MQFWIVLCKYIEAQLIFVYWSCILQPPLNSFVNFHIYLKVFYIRDHIMWKQRYFYFFLSNMDVFYFFSCPVALPGPLVQCWIKVVRVDIFSCSDFRGKTSSLLPLSTVLITGFEDALVMLEQVPILSLLNIFYHLKATDFVDCFSCV